MTDFEQYAAKLQIQERSRDPQTMTIRPAQGGGHVVTLGLNEDKRTQIAPVQVHLDKSGNTTTVVFPNQNRSGVNVMTGSPKLTQTLVSNAGRGGTDFLVGIANAIAGANLTYDHTDPTKAFSARATGDLPDRAAAALGSVLSAAERSGASYVTSDDPKSPMRSYRSNVQASKANTGFSDPSGKVR